MEEGRLARRVVRGRVLGGVVNGLEGEGIGSPEGRSAMGCCWEGISAGAVSVVDMIAVVFGGGGGGDDENVVCC